jgi:hypothetical protein
MARGPTVLTGAFPKTVPAMMWIGVPGPTMSWRIRVSSRFHNPAEPLKPLWCWGATLDS